MKSNVKYQVLVLVLLFFALTSTTLAQGTDCGSSADITVNGSCLSGTATDATISGPATGCTANTAIREAWYKFTLASAQVLNITASIGSDASGQDNLVIQIIQQVGACGNPGGADVEVGCADGSQFDGAQTEALSYLSLAAGTYHIRLINNAGAASGNMPFSNLCVCIPPAPGLATSPLPANGTSNVNKCTTLSWTAPTPVTCDARASSYDVYFGTTSNPPFVTNVSSITYTPSDLASNTTYYWKIVPKNPTGNALGALTWSFTTATFTSQYAVSANASINGDCVVLTGDVNSQKGCAWDANSTLNFASNFSYDFIINLGDDNAGADGLSFVIQNDPLGLCKCGTDGGSFGAGGISNSLIVEVDTYLNAQDRDDGIPGVLCSGGPEPDHLDIWLNGNVEPSTDFNDCLLSAAERIVPNAVPLLNAGADYNIENGLNHILRISWNAATQTLTASIKNTGISTTYGTISHSFNPMTVFGTNTPYFGFTAATGGLSNQQIFCNPPVLLPIELLSYDAKLNHKKTVDLTWETAAERNNDYFTIEKSLDGLNWSFLGNVDGAGDSSIPLSYYLEDPNPAYGINYYKLSQTDFNGASQEKGIRQVTIKNEAGFFLSPNPASTSFSIYGKDADKAEITIVDNLGKIVSFHKNIISNDHIEINTEHLSCGLYNVRFYVDEVFLDVLKLVKQ